MNDREAYIKISERLFRGVYLRELTLSSKIVYSYLHKRNRLSIKNNFKDKKGQICVIVPKKQIKEKLGFSMNTITNAFARLKKVGLITTKRQGQGKPNLIYIENISEMDSFEVQENKNQINNLSKENAGFSDSSDKINISKENCIDEKNKNGFSKKSKTNEKMVSSLEEYAKYKEIIKENILYEKFVIYERYGMNNSVKLIDEIVELITDVVCSTAKEIKIGQNWYSKEVVKSKFLKLKYLDIDYVIENITKHPYKIKNMRQYLITCLFNSNTNSEMSLENQVYSDMCKGFTDSNKNNYPQREYKNSGEFHIKEVVKEADRIWKEIFGEDSSVYGHG